MVKVVIQKGDEYSKWIGFLKTLKNVGVTYGIPALIYFLNSYAEWMPQKYVAVSAPFIGGILYMVKNYVSNK